MDWRSFWNDSPQVRDADFRRQVGRTFRQHVYSDRQVDALVDGLRKHLQPSPDKTLLDLACGNGLITSRLASGFREVIGVDFSQRLIQVATKHFGRDNVTYLVGDVVDLDIAHGVFDRVLLSAAAQHLSPSQMLRLSERLATMVAPGGRLVFGDVADGDRMWNFYRGLGGRCRYAWGAVRRRPIIGFWWKPSDLLRVSQARGWSLSIHYQTTDLPNHYFRYDAVFEVPGRPEPSGRKG